MLQFHMHPTRISKVTYLQPTKLDSFQQYVDVYVQPYHVVHVYEDKGVEK
ncbi:hypothetical protein Sjap_021365 [Stephania japonica]|uniref:Uncharacterized protein n=1 Tax=Stephania japonica TaxID=461633 RepID=A0AAP0ESG4_9MAGN